MEALHLDERGQLRLGALCEHGVGGAHICKHKSSSFFVRLVFPLGLPLVLAHAPTLSLVGAPGQLLAFRMQLVSSTWREKTKKTE